MQMTLTDLQTQPDYSLPWAQFADEYPEFTYGQWAYGREKLRKTAAKSQPVFTPTERPNIKHLLARYAQVHSEGQEALDQAHPIKLATDNPVGVCIMGDWHIGNRGTDIQRLIHDVDLVSSHPRLYTIVGGDPIDNYIFGSLNTAAREDILTPEEQWELYRELITRLSSSGSLLCVGGGNHDQWTGKAAGIDGIMSALRGIPVVYTGELGYIDLDVGDIRYTIYRKHRPERNTSQLNVHNSLKRKLERTLPREFDIGVHEHHHTPGLEVWQYRGKKRIAVTCGSYKFTDSYAWERGFHDPAYGVPTIVLSPRVHRMTPFTSIEEAADALDGLL